MKRIDNLDSGKLSVIVFIKYLFFLIIILFLVISQGSCRKNPKCACGVEHPEENLPWLKGILNSCFCVDVYQNFFNDTEYISISTCDAASDIIEDVYQCDGTWVCEHGGMWGFCYLSSAFWEAYYKDRILIYQLRIYP